MLGPAEVLGRDTGGPGAYDGLHVENAQRAEVGGAGGRACHTTSYRRYDSENAAGRGLLSLSLSLVIPDHTREITGQRPDRRPGGRFGVILAEPVYGCGWYDTGP